MKQDQCDILIIGAGIIGISTAYYLAQFAPLKKIMLLDMDQPMALTSAQSGENYRNWWPHPVMTAFTNRSINLMEDIARETSNLINMNRGGYALATRADQIDQLMTELYAGYAGNNSSDIRIRDSSSADYVPPNLGTWHSSPSGVDVLTDSRLIQNTFPSFSDDIKTVVHIRRGGSISAQQMGQYMLDSFRANGGKLIIGEATGIRVGDNFSVEIKSDVTRIQTGQLVNAAGPFIDKIATMIGYQLPVINTLQQKVAFEDTVKAIPRNMPFAIDLDAQCIDWTDEEKYLIATDSQMAWLAEEMPGAIHCRPDGGKQGSWVKMGWAFNEAPSTPQRIPDLFDYFPEIVLRGAARLNPSLKQYYDNLPANRHHYGGFYTTTEENWPLIGNTGIDESYVVGAMSGFGTMAACAAGELCAQTVLDIELPEYAAALSPDRYKNFNLMSELKALASRGIL